MSFTFGSRAPRQLPPSGASNAVITGIYNIGSQWNQFNNRYTPQVVITIQLDKVDQQGKPVEISKTFTASMDPRSNLRSWVSNILGRGLSESEASSLDVSSVLVGAQVTLMIQHEPVPNTPGEMRYKITSVMPSTANVVAAGQLKKWDCRDGDWASAPNWILNRVTKSQEYMSKFPNGSGPIEAKQASQNGQGGFGQARGGFYPPQGQPAQQQAFAPQQQPGGWQQPQQPPQQYPQQPPAQQPGGWQQPPQAPAQPPRPGGFGNVPPADDYNF